MLLCIYAISAMRGPAKRAIIVGTVVQSVVVITGLWINAYLVPGIIFGLCWALAIWLSGKIDRFKTSVG
jgi:hypothetical protein